MIEKKKMYPFINSFSQLHLNCICRVLGLVGKEGQEQKGGLTTDAFSKTLQSTMSEEQDRLLMSQDVILRCPFKQPNVRAEIFQLKYNYFEEITKLQRTSLFTEFSTLPCKSF